MLFGIDVNFFGVFFVIFMLYLAGTLVFFWVDAKKYKQSLTLMRKVFYVGYFISIGIAIVCGWIDYRDWVLLTQMTALMVFVDLAVFQTPNILKVWNAELKHDDIQEIIEKNQDTLQYNASKVEKFLSVVQYTPIHFEDVNPPIHWRQYKDDVRTYLQLYADTFQFQVALFPFKATSDEVELRKSIVEAIRNLGLGHNYRLPTDDKEKERIISSITSGGSLSLQKDKLYVVSYFGETFNCLITIEAGGKASVDGIDASHVLSLAQIFDWWNAP